MAVLAPDSPEYLIKTSLPSHLQTLMLRSFGCEEEQMLSDRGVRSFCDGNWQKLTRLDLIGQGLSAESTRLLASAPLYISTSTS